MNAQPVNARNRFLHCCMLLAFAPCAAAADEVYRWVDDEGTVHFSDTPPASASTNFSTIDIGPSTGSSFDPEADVFNIEATRERTQQRRGELEEQREARAERARHASAPVTQAPVQREYPVGVAWPRYPGYPGHPVRPVPPIHPGPKPEPQPRPPSTLQPPGAVAVPLEPADSAGG